MKTWKDFKRSILFFLATFSLFSWGEGKIDGTRRLQTLNSSFQAMAFNPTLDANRTVLNELLGTNTPQYQWPAFPRTWFQMEKAKTQETTTTFGGHLNLKIASAAGKVGVQYAYGQKISLIVVSSLRKSSAVTEDLSQSPEEDLNQVTYFDPHTNQRYFNVNEDYPMVGFCAYEMSLKIGKTKDGSLSFLGVGQTLALNEYQAETIVLYSNFFQIKKDLSVQGHMQENCESNFLQRARPYVEDDFARIVMEYFTLYHPNNQCRLGGPTGENGDEDCLTWHQRGFDPITRKTTVPRCEQQSDGVSRCVVRAKKGFSCPLYMDRHNRFTDVFQPYQNVTFNDYAHTCDQGLKCTMDRNPLALGSLVMWPGAATCK
jgi:hypothetical protein